MFFHLFKCDSDFHAIILYTVQNKEQKKKKKKLTLLANITLQLLEVAGLLKMHLSKV